MGERLVGRCGDDSGCTRGEEFFGHFVGKPGGGVASGAGALDGPTSGVEGVEVVKGCLQEARGEVVALYGFSDADGK